MDLVVKTTPFKLANLLDDETLLRTVHDTIDKVEQITTLQIILSVLPTITVILVLSLLVGVLHKKFAEVDYKKTSYLFSYIFGAQITGVLVVLAITNIVLISRKTIPIYVPILPAIIFAILLLLSPAISLRVWFGIKHGGKIFNTNAYILYVFLVLCIAVVYFNTIAGTYTHLKPAVKSKDEKIRIVNEEVENKLIVTVYKKTLQKNAITFSLLLHNRSGRAYFLHDKGSAMLMAASREKLEEMMSGAAAPQDKSTEEMTELLKAYLQRITVSTQRIDLKLIDKTGTANRLIQAGEKYFITYRGSLQTHTVPADEISGILYFPVARVNTEGSLDYVTISREFGLAQQDLYANFEREKARSDEETNKEILKRQDEFGQMLKDLQRMQSGAGADKQKPKTPSQTPW